MSFKFEKGQRVAVPGQGITQGVILDIVESVPGCPIYTLRWLNEVGEPITGSVGELNIEIQNPELLPLSKRSVTASPRKPAPKSKRKR